MNATLSTPEKTMQVSDEMLNAFLTLVSLTTKFSLPETIGHQPVFEYEMLVYALIDEYNDKL